MPAPHAENDDARDRRSYIAGNGGAAVRPIFCDRHQAIFRGLGTSRVLARLVFNFCAKCWTDDREGCEEYMRRIAHVPETGFAPAAAGVCEPQLNQQLHGEQEFYE